MRLENRLVARDDTKQVKIHAPKRRQTLFSGGHIGASRQKLLQTLHRKIQRADKGEPIYRAHFPLAISPFLEKLPKAGIIPDRHQVDVLHRLLLLLHRKRGKAPKLLLQHPLLQLFVDLLFAEFDKILIEQPQIFTKGKNRPKNRNRKHPNPYKRHRKNLSPIHLVIIILIFFENANFDGQPFPHLVTYL